MSIDEEKLHEFLHQAVGDMSAACSATMMLLGDRLGLYKTLSEGTMTAAELARRTGTAERYVREWLCNQAAGGYVQYDADTEQYSLSEEQALCLANPDSPVDVPGAYGIVEAMFHALDRNEDNFRTGKGMEWGEHHHCLFDGIERFFGAAYRGSLVSAWLPALNGTVDTLTGGGKAADVGCGHGASTVLMAQAFPKSEFTGYDYHPESIDVARQRAADAGVDNVRFEVADATGYDGNDYDLIAFFDCLHDMADPVGAARHAREAIADDGTCMLVEPMAGDRPQDNHNPVGRLYYAGSTQLCVPMSLARKGPALGAQAGEARIQEVMVDGGGFTQFRRATETPFNIVLEARP